MPLKLALPVAVLQFAPRPILDLYIVPEIVGAVAAHAKPMRPGLRIVATPIGNWLASATLAFLV